MNVHRGVGRFFERLGATTNDTTRQPNAAVKRSRPTAVDENMQQFNATTCASSSKCSAIDEKTRQLKHATSSFNKGWNLSLTEEYDCALQAFFHALEIRELWLGKLHMDTAKTHYQIAIVYQQTKRLDESLVFFRRAYQAWDVACGKDHPNTMDAEAGIEEILEEQGMDDRGVRDYIDGFISSIERAKSAEVHHQRGELAQALWEYQTQLTLSESAIGKLHPDTADIYYKIATVQDDAEEYESAVESYQTAAVIYETCLGAKNPTLAGVYSKIADIHLKDSQGDMEVAAFMYENAFSIYNEKLGCSHPDTIKTFSEVRRINRRIEENQNKLKKESEKAKGLDMSTELEGALLCPCCQVNQFSADPLDECAPIMSDACGHSICRSCVKRCTNTRCPLCKAYHAFPQSHKLQRANRSLCEVVGALERMMLNGTGGH